MIIALVQIVGGAICLSLGADRFITGAIGISKRLEISPVIIGIILLGFGTSLPELLVSVVACLKGSGDLSAATAVGSSITNIGLGLGLTACLYPLQVPEYLLKKEFPALFCLMLPSVLLLLDHQLTRNDGLILMGVLAGLIYWLIRLARRREIPVDTGEKIHLSLKVAMLWTLIGIGALVLGSAVFVDGAKALAILWEVSDSVIGLTVMSVGTSLPEVFVTLMAAIKKEPELAIGHVIGSNMFNLLGVLAVPALFQPGNIPDSLIQRDIPILWIFTLLLFFFSYGFKKPPEINRLEGAALLMAYLSYCTFLYW